MFVVRRWQLAIVADGDNLKTECQNLKGFYFQQSGHFYFWAINLFTILVPIFSKFRVIVPIWEQG